MATLTPPGPIERRVLVFGVIAAIAISYFGCKDPLTWLLEIIWVLVGLPWIAWKCAPRTGANSIRTTTP